MELDTTLLWFALAGGGVTLITGLRMWRAGDRVYAAIGAFILALTGLVYLLAPSAAGYAGTAAWLVGVLAPNIASRAAARAAGRRDHRWAIRWSRLVYALHPSASARQNLRDRRAAFDLFEGRFADAEAAFREAAPASGVERHAVELSCLRIRADWAATVAYFEANVSEDEAVAQPLLLHAYLRALGELGRRRDLVGTYAHYAPRLSSAERQPHRVGAWLFLFAFTGERSCVDRLFKRLLTGHPPELAELWKFTADIAAGAPVDDDVVARLGKSNDAGVRAMIQRRLKNADVLVAEPIDDDMRDVVDAAARALAQEEELGASTVPEARPWTTYALILLNVAGFVFELTKGTDTTNDQLLVDAGAFFTPSILAGAWWRLGTYMFLHAGFLHITLNLFAFYLFAPFVERALGAVRFAVLYVLTGLAGSGTLLFFQCVLGEEYAPAVGASGCVMGVIGATIAILFRAWWKERAAIAGARLRLLLLMIGVQTVIDLTQKQISFKAHAAGLVSGVLFGAALMATRAAPSPPASRPAVFRGKP